MSVPPSEVSYTPAMPRREDHEVHKDMWWQWTQKKIKSNAQLIIFHTFSNKTETLVCCNFNFMLSSLFAAIGRARRPVKYFIAREEKSFNSLIYYYML